MALQVKLTKGNQQLVKGTHLPSGETFYIRAEKTRGGVNVLLDGDRDIFVFNRVSTNDLIFDEFGHILRVEVDKDAIGNRLAPLPYDYQETN